MKKSDTKTVMEFPIDNSLEDWLEENKPKDTFKMNKLKFWWRFKEKFIPRDFIIGIKNLIKWLPIIWKDRNWDHAYIYDVLAFKLKLQSEFIGEKGSHTNAKRDAGVMMVCSFLAKRLSDEYYETEMVDFEDIGDYFSKYSNTYRKMLKKYPDARPSQLKYYVAQENVNKAKRILFGTLENRINEWWD